MLRAEASLYNHRVLSVASEVSFEDFLQTDYKQPVEWVAGEVIPLTPVQLTHARLCEFLSRSIGAYVEGTESGEVLSEPFVMKTGPDLPGRSPDLMFVASTNQQRLQTLFLEGPADLVIEVLSPESRGRDRGDKYYEYESGEVREYWLLDPYRKSAEFYVLAEGRFQPLFPDGDGVYTSKVLPELWFRVSEFWGPPFPALIVLLSRWGILK